MWTCFENVVVLKKNIVATPKRELQSRRGDLCNPYNPSVYLIKGSWWMEITIISEIIHDDVKTLSSEIPMRLRKNPVSLPVISSSLKAMGYDLTGSSELTVIPSVCAVAVAAAAGTAADRLHGEGMSLTTVRKARGFGGDLGG